MQPTSKPSEMDAQLELLISRQLDGELSPEGELELNKMLIKSPSARTLMEEYERNDHLAKMALRAVLSPDEFRPLLQAEWSRQSPGRWKKVLWGVSSVGAVAAAVVVAFVGANLFESPRPSPRPLDVPVVAGTEPADVPPVVADAQGTAPDGSRLRPLGPPIPLMPTYVKDRRVERFLVPVITRNADEQDELSVLQVERRRENIRLTAGEL